MNEMQPARTMTGRGWEREWDICAYCGQFIEGRGYRCGRGVVHERCLDEMKEPKILLEFIRENREAAEEFLEEHMSDSFLDDFWAVFREDYALEIERWATS